MIDTNRYVGIPYRRNGRTLDGLDCYGLVLLGLRDLGVTAPDYTSEGMRDGWRQMTAAAQGPHWHRTDDPCEGDVAAFGRPGLVKHVGLLIGKQYLLHCRAPLGGALQRIEDVRRQTGLMLLGYYRYG